jgi:hypothetical protein
VLGEATITELCLIGGLRSAYIACETGMVPAPGRYVLAHVDGSETPLATVLFAAEYRPAGFVAAPPVPGEWRPGSVLDLRGPLGNGFELPLDCRRVALIAFNNDPNRLLPLIATAARQDAAVAMVCGAPPSDLRICARTGARPADTRADPSWKGPGPGPRSNAVRRSG